MTPDSSFEWPFPILPVIGGVYTARLEYFATGEGLRNEVLVTVASSEDEARERFWETFWPDEPVARDYFGPGLRISPGVDRERLATWFSEALLGELEQRTRQTGMLKLSLDWWFNVS